MHYEDLNPVRILIKTDFIIEFSFIFSDSQRALNYFLWKGMELWNTRSPKINFPSTRVLSLIVLKVLTKNKENVGNQS